MISIIASVGKNNELGKDNQLIWKIPNDMKFFKNTTMGHTVIMGKNTYLSLPGDLPGRKMIVLSSENFSSNIEIINDKKIIIDRYKGSSEEVFIIGGASIYEQFLPYVNKIYLTEIDDSCKCASVYFPDFDKSLWNKKIINSGIYKNLNYKMCLYLKK